MPLVKTVEKKNTHTHTHIHRNKQKLRPARSVMVAWQSVPDRLFVLTVCKFQPLLRLLLLINKIASKQAHKKKSLHTGFFFCLCLPLFCPSTQSSGRIVLLLSFRFDFVVAAAAAAVLLQFSYLLLTDVQQGRHTFPISGQFVGSDEPGGSPVRTHAKLVTHGKKKAPHTRS